MNQPTPAPQSRLRRGPVVMIVLVLAGVALVMVLLLRSVWQSPTPNLLVEIPRKDLFLRDGLLCLAGSGVPFTGMVTDAYDGGELKSRSMVSNGLLAGLSQGWWTNGVLQVSEFYSNGISHGVRTKYYPDGSKLSVVTVLNGKLEGRFERWHPNGNLAEQVDLKNGEPDGESLAYHPDGTLKARVRLDHGKVVEQKFWAAGEAGLAAAAAPVGGRGQ